MKKFRFIIIVIIILIAFNEILDYQNEKTRETLKQDRVKAEKRLEKSKDTIPQILLVPAKKLIVYEKIIKTESRTFNWYLNYY